MYPAHVANCIYMHGCRFKSVSGVPLTQAEKEVATEIAKGLSNKEIADLRFTSEKTVKLHVTNIYQKMQVRSRAQFQALIFERDRKALLHEVADGESRLIALSMQVKDLARGAA